MLHGSDGSADEEKAMVWAQRGYVAVAPDMPGLYSPLTHGRRVDFEYERADTPNIFMFTEPLAGWREVSVRATETKADWTLEMAPLLEVRYAACPKVIAVCGNLNTHTRGAFHEAFEPERATRLVRRLDFRHTPRHGSWLNIAENALSAMTRQCAAGRRFSDIDTLRKQTSA